MELRTHQTEAIEAMRDAICNGSRSIVFAERTGWGRSATLLGLASHLEGRKLAVVGRPLVDWFSHVADSLGVHIELSSAGVLYRDADRNFSGLGFVIFGECWPQDDKARHVIIDRIRKANPDCIIVEEGRSPRERHTWPHDAVIERMDDGRLHVDLVATPGMNV